MTLSATSRIGEYVVSAKLGAGGMGEVYRARDTKLNRDVAIKVLPELFAADPERLARFTREAQTLAALNHSNIAQIYGVVDQPAALIMEFADGEDLSAIIARGPLPAGEAVAIARQIADALEAAHEQGIVHRDLKPANIKVKADGTVKVLDFGLAKAMDPNAGPEGPAYNIVNSPTFTAHATQMGVILGTAAYMAPEQAKGKTVDKRADIWAFGVVLFEMLTGHQTFAGDTISEVMAAVMKDDPDWTRLPPNLPPQVVRVLKRCLIKDPRQRLRDIGDARLLLDDTEAPAPSHVDARPTPRRTWKFVIGPAITIGSIAVAVILTSQLRPTVSSPHTRRLSVSAPDGTDLMPDPRQSAISPDGTMVAFVTGTVLDYGAHSSSDKAELWIRPLDSPQARLIHGATGASQPFWSPDSRRIGFFADGKLKTVAVEGGRVEVLCDARDGRGGTWGSADTIVFAPSSAGALLAIAASGGQPSPATVLDSARKETGHRFPFFLPDGHHFLFAALPAGLNGYEIYVGSIGNPARTRLLSADSAPVYTEPGYLLFARKGVVAVQRFDARSLTLTGDAVMLDDVIGFLGNQFSAGSVVSATADTFVYLNDPFSNTSLVWADLQGRQIGVVDAPIGRYYEIKLSPDNQRAAVVKLSSASESSLWVLDLVRHGATRIADAPHWNYQVAWSPDGMRLAYANDGSGTETVFVRDAAAAKPAAVLYASADLFKKPQSWSPDGRTLLFETRQPGTDNDLFTIDLAGTAKAAPYLHDAFSEDSARFSPDGRWVAYVSDESGTNDVYVRSFPTPERKYRVTVDGGAAVWWKRDGSALLIVGADARQLKLARVRPGVDLSIDPPQVVGAVPEGALAVEPTSDLQRMLVAVPKAGSAKPSLMVVSDWRSALKR